MVGLEISVYITEQDSQRDFLLELEALQGCPSVRALRATSIFWSWMRAGLTEGCDSKENLSVEIGGKLVMFGAVFPVGFYFL